MILNSAPANEAILSNVGQIGEFRIRNSAKAFSILSSGLYANKIKAIVRELSCNAIDSHTAANNINTPFDVHLPNAIEPWFAVRDYGTGLSHDQVCNIYTTYFESTKTESNQFIGALGLGSKSPFSYTDNFTVTAIKDGTRGIYSAFINEQGVPSIALMQSDTTTDPNGVEVKFAVDKSSDFSSFKIEAKQVFTYFKNRPVISGCSNFVFTDEEYEDKDIAPGVHLRKSRSTSIAVMGNIAYPISVPESDSTLGSVVNMLGCGLEINFEIGELDFQANREGLSYVPLTLNSIKAKLEQLVNSLMPKLVKEIDAIPNIWHKKYALDIKRSKKLWTQIVNEYCTSTNFPLMKMDSGHLVAVPFTFTTQELADKYNINLAGFSKQRHYAAATDLHPAVPMMRGTIAPGPQMYTWSIFPKEHTYFVKNDTTVGAITRAKLHWKMKQHSSYDVVYVVTATDKKKPVLFDQFMAALNEPPQDQRMLVSSLHQKERVVKGKNVSILVLQEKSSYHRYRNTKFTWSDAGSAANFDPNTTFYYIPLSGYTIHSKFGFPIVHTLVAELRNSGIEDLRKTLYGVRKKDIEYIKTQKNWVNIEDYVLGELQALSGEVALQSAVKMLDTMYYMHYNKGVVDKVKTDSPYYIFIRQYKDVPRIKTDFAHVTRLLKTFKVPHADYDLVKKRIQAECNAIHKRYPLLTLLPNMESAYADVADYINLIDLTTAQRGTVNQQLPL